MILHEIPCHSMMINSYFPPYEIRWYINNTTQLHSTANWGSHHHRQIQNIKVPKESRKKKKKKVKWANLAVEVKSKGMIDNQTAGSEGDGDGAAAG